MKTLHEQAKDLSKDAEDICKKILLGEDVTHEIAQLCYMYADLRIDLINQGER